MFWVVLTLEIFVNIVTFFVVLLTIIYVIFFNDSLVLFLVTFFIVLLVVKLVMFTIF